MGTQYLVPTKVADRGPPNRFAQRKAPEVGIKYCVPETALTGAVAACRFPRPPDNSVRRRSARSPSRLAGGGAGGTGKREMSQGPLHYESKKPSVVEKF